MRFFVELDDLPHLLWFSAAKQPLQVRRANGLVFQHVLSKKKGAKIQRTPKEVSLFPQLWPLISSKSLAKTPEVDCKVAGSPIEGVLYDEFLGESRPPLLGESEDPKENISGFAGWITF